jgi:hypothetical protein
MASVAIVTDEIKRGGWRLCARQVLVAHAVLSWLAP